MENLIERYIYDVVRRLPEKEGQDVRRELRANIDDMLPENPSEADVEAVLCQLGAPADLADQYRQQPRFLISPAVYSDYIRALKWVLPLVAGILFVLGMVLALTDSTLDIAATEIFAHTLTQGIGLAVEGSFQVLFWITLGFAIADRAGYRRRQTPWQIRDLPKALPNDKKRISLSDSIVGLVLSVVFTAVAVLFCLGALPQLIILRQSNAVVYLFANPQDMPRFVLPILLIGLFSAAEGIVKIVFRAWQPPVFAAVLVSNLVCAPLPIYILLQTNLFGLQLSLNLGESVNWWISNGLGMVICATIAVVAIIECGSALYKTFFAKAAQ